MDLGEYADFLKRKTPFSYNEAFSRSLGFLTPTEALVLKTKTVAIAGCGGVGGHYAEVLARLGVTKFRIADPDFFEMVNFNRQNASGINSLGQSKVEVIRQRILDINPEAEVICFYEGVNDSNRDAFLSGTDLYLDGLDFFVIDERLSIFRSLREKGIPGITVAPTGMGAALLVFTEKSMSFDQYFGLANHQSKEERAIRFLVGLTPSLIQRKSQVEYAAVNFSLGKVPSTPMGCYLCAGVAGTTALKLLLNRGPVQQAPWSLHFDAYSNTYKKKYVWGGASNPIQIFKRWLVKKILSSQT